MPHAIRCQRCGRPFGAVESPDPAALRAALAKFHLSALASMIPPNVAEALATTLAFDCGDCLQLTTTDDATREEAGQEVIPLDGEARAGHEASAQARRRRRRGDRHDDPR